MVERKNKSYYSRHIYQSVYVNLIDIEKEKVSRGYYNNLILSFL